MDTYIVCIVPNILSNIVDVDDVVWTIYHDSTFVKYYCSRSNKDTVRNKKNYRVPVLDARLCSKKLLNTYFKLHSPSVLVSSFFRLAIAPNQKFKIVFKLVSLSAVKHKSYGKIIYIEAYDVWDKKTFSL